MLLSSLCSSALPHKEMLKVVVKLDNFMQCPTCDDLLGPKMHRVWTMLLHYYRSGPLEISFAEQILQDDNGIGSSEVLEAALAELRKEPATTVHEYQKACAERIKSFKNDREGDFIRIYWQILNDGYTDKKSKKVYKGVGAAVQWLNEQQHIVSVESEFGMIPPAQPHQWLVPGLIPRSGVSFFFGSGGVGKTTVMLDTLQRIYEQRPVFDFYDVTEQKPKTFKTLYIYGDKSSQWFSDYYLHRFQGDWLKNLSWIFPVDRKFHKLEPYELRGYIQTSAAELCVVDTFASIAGLKRENDNTEVGDYMLDLVGVAAETSCNIILLDHPRKRGRNKDGSFQALGADDLCGGSAKNRFAAMSLIIDNKFQGSTVRDSCGYIHLGKAGIITGFPGEIHFDISADGVHYSATEMSIEDRKEMSAKMSAVLNFIPVDTPIKKANIVTAASASMSESTVKRELSKLLEENKIEKTGHGLYKRVEIKELEDNDGLTTGGF
jgi:AAA domain